MVYVKEKAEEFIITAELKDWVLIVALISLTVQLIVKLFENVVLGCITNAMIKVWKKCCRLRNGNGSIEIGFITARQGSEFIHLTDDCCHAKRVNEMNKKYWKVCSECNNYFVKKVERAFQVRLEDEV